MTTKSEDIKLPKWEKIDRGIWRYYHVGDKIGKPSGSFYAEPQVGWKINGKGERVPERAYLKADTKAAMRKLIEDAKAKGRAGVPQDRRAQPLVDYLRRWLCDKYSLVDLTPSDYEPSKFRVLARERILSKHYNTAKHYNRIIEQHIVPVLGAYRLDELQPEQIQLHVNHLASQGKGRTAEYVCQVLSAAYNTAKKRRILVWSPMEGVTRPSYEKKSGSKEPLTPLEIRALLQTAEEAQDSFYALWAVSAGTGCRPGELLGLHRNDVHVNDPDNAFVVIRRRLIAVHDGKPTFAENTKSGEKGNAVLSIAPDVAWALIAHLNGQAADREHVGEQYLDYGLVFCSERGLPLVERSVVRAFKKALQRASITREVRLYDFRHAHATTILERGFDIKFVQQRLRHTSLSVLNTTYAHVRRAADAEVARAVSDAFRVDRGGEMAYAAELKEADRERFR